jgi:hypothetical protein
VRLVALDSGQSVVFLVQVSESNIIYCALGTLYKYALLEGTKISKVWGSYHNFHLAHPILIRPMALQRRHIRELQNKIFRPRRAEILEIQQKKDHLAEPPPNQGLKVILGQHATKKGNFYTK